MLPATTRPVGLARLTPATNLAELAQTLEARPLQTSEELQAFYRENLKKFKGGDKLEDLRLELVDSLAGPRPLRAFVIGHPGAGKTTELMHLLLGMEDRFRTLRLSATGELNPGNIRFYDILLLILLKLVHSVSQPDAIGFEDTDLQQLLRRVRDHLATKWDKRLRTEQSDFGAGLSLPFLKLFGNLKLGQTREQGVEEYEVSFVSELVALTNELVDECNRLLLRHKGQRWLVVVEDIEKMGLAPARLKDLFIGLRPSLDELNVHLLVTIPPWLRFSQDADMLLPPSFASFLIPDLPVYRQDHTRDEGALEALKEVVAARASLALFEPRVLDRCCVASGGNLRDLFILIRSSMLTARRRGAAAISCADADGAIAELRHEYKQRMGTTGQDASDISLDEKLKRLAEVYRREDPKIEVPDRVTYLLLRQRCLLQYNGQFWMGVHPLVVDLLIEFGTLPAGSPGGSLP